MTSGNLPMSDNGPNRPEKSDFVSTVLVQIGTIGVLLLVAYGFGFLISGSVGGLVGIAILALLFAQMTSEVLLARFGEWFECGLTARGLNPEFTIPKPYTKALLICALIAATLLFAVIFRSH